MYRGRSVSVHFDPSILGIYPGLLIGVDIIGAQAGEGGGHTGDTPFSILIPAVVDLCKDAKSPLTGEPIVVVAAGGISDGRGLAASLAYVHALTLN